MDWKVHTHGTFEPDWLMLVTDPRSNQMTGDLFDPGQGFNQFADPRKLARRTDPETSHKAAEDIAPKVPRMEREILGRLTLTAVSALKSWTAREIGPEAHKRMRAMVEKDWVKQCAPRHCTVTGKRVTTYAITEAGREALRS